MNAQANDAQQHTDLGIAWTWSYDASFVAALKEAAGRGGVSVVEITRASIESVTRKVLAGALHIGYLFDRASDEDDAFRTLASWMLRDHRSDRPGGMRVINPADDARRAADKATMHLEFITHGIHVPHTIILPPYTEQPDLHIPESDMQSLGSPFVIKPANTTGGGAGVILTARSMADVVRHRMTYERDKYLLQRRVEPVYLSEARAWFRVFYAFGESWICWWDDQTHVYEDVSPDEERWFGLGELRRAIQTIAGVCRLGFFSSEFAQTADGTYVSVDYVNELCDMRPKSTARDGVPDRLLEWVAEQLVASVGRERPDRNDKGLEA